MFSNRLQQNDRFIHLNSRLIELGVKCDALFASKEEPG
jgi:hypothetical protein